METFIQTGLHWLLNISNRNFSNSIQKKQTNGSNSEVSSSYLSICYIVPHIEPKSYLTRISLVLYSYSVCPYCKKKPVPI